ncbi:MAG: TetR/AcrR family transcriptional regulator [Candidatus Heimdallarchaeota archaeon]
MPKVVPEYKEQARIRIIEQALKMFSELGYYRTRMKDIAGSLGVSKGAIYQYFKSKEQLFIEVIKYHGEKRAKVVRRFLDSGSLKAISSSEFFDEMLELSLSNLSLGIELLHETARNKVLRKMLVGVIEGWGQGLTKLIDEMKSNGMIRTNVDSSSLSRGILALRDGLYSHLMMGADTTEVRKTWVDIMGHLMKDIIT